MMFYTWPLYLMGFNVINLQLCLHKFCLLLSLLPDFLKFYMSISIHIYFIKLKINEQICSIISICSAGLKSEVYKYLLPKQVIHCYLSFRIYQIFKFIQLCSKKEYINFKELLLMLILTNPTLFINILFFQIHIILYSK